jgi:hypothetical protein
MLEFQSDKDRAIIIRIPEVQCCRVQLLQRRDDTVGLAGFLLFSRWSVDRHPTDEYVLLLNARAEQLLNGSAGTDVSHASSQRVAPESQQ